MSAGIYIRVSSEAQTEGASLSEQQRLCEKLAKEKGLKVVEVYQDVASGTDLQRPALLKMLADVEAGKINTILAWGSDRLFRGGRAARPILDAVEDSDLKIELVTDVFDKKTAEVQAWASGIENDIRAERFALGMKASLRNGLPWNIQQKYGYDIDENGKAIINKAEAKIIRKIFDLRLAGHGGREIARRLEKMRAPRKIGGRLKWPPNTIYRILNSEIYASGIHIINYRGERYEAKVPKIIEPAQHKQVQALLKKSRSHPARNVKYNYLLSGLLTSPCGRKWRGYSRPRQQKWTKKSTGETRTYEGLYQMYYCTMNTGIDEHHPDCPKTKGVKRLDNRIWESVSEIIRNPKFLHNIVNTELEKVQAKQDQAEETLADLSKQLANIEDERAAKIDAYGRLDNFTLDDLNKTLDSLGEIEARLKDKITQTEVLLQYKDSEIARRLSDYIKNLLDTLELLEKTPANDKEADRQFAKRKELADLLVSEVVLTKSSPPLIHFTLSPLQSKFLDS